MQRRLLIFIAALGPAVLAATPAGATVRNYFSPEWQGVRLAACLEDQESCGKPAADAFCKSQGFDKALLFQRESHGFTRVIGSERTCKGGNCTAFRQIKCYSHASTVSPVVQ